MSHFGWISGSDKDHQSDKTLWDNKKLKRAIHNKRTGMLTKGDCLMQDNAKPHKANTTTQFLDSFGRNVLNDLPYFPDLSSSDYDLCTSPKLHMSEKVFKERDGKVRAGVKFGRSRYEKIDLLSHQLHRNKWWLYWKIIYTRSLVLSFVPLAKISYW